jgi:hypothetical protein
MKKVISMLVVVGLLLCSNVAIAKGKNGKEEKTISDYLTPMETLVGEYYKIVAQIKQKENEIEQLKMQLERIDAVIKYQRGIEQNIEADKMKTDNP